MSGPLKEIHRLFFPPVCPVCGRSLGEGSGSVCTACLLDVPLTGYEREADNPVARRFWGLIPVERASAFIFFVHNSGYRRLVHDFKYRGSWKFARDLGEWYGRELESSELYSDIDLIIPVPLHLRKKLSRGYNQSDYIAEGISKAMAVPVVRNNVIRRKNNKSQAQRPKSERWDNVEGIFSVRQPESLAGKHLLLVDDVLTTGATMLSCAETIIRAVPDCRISIAVLYASRHELGIKD